MDYWCSRRREGYCRPSTECCHISSVGYTCERALGRPYVTESGEYGRFHRYEAPRGLSPESPRRERAPPPVWLRCRSKGRVWGWMDEEAARLARRVARGLLGDNGVDGFEDDCSGFCRDDVHCHEPPVADPERRAAMMARHDRIDTQRRRMEVQRRLTHGFRREIQRRCAVLSATKSRA
ncbi:unnamed protein product [Vitrella brassicaformis CCMP3155]|uniref:Uncharacterized protein n=1 Tax=Vitrella brassicaformis (strain CCMP3155) TaxID=1169540 RepID=A0A0G4FI32_VITBC|nr:unnamed protein product [Vitrella brassicaformis CCMP3155]|mmetsp:Transcript_33326/g.82575  ORF Transcript_33326/g.82575 Transcript_33326/m.82575 type:complete len:179 (-) Transcript_33326:135-671(-)|eukprot:CEM13154.1 unnamed protein product [Vitrella brassicaformis CCMP3155]